MENNLLEEYLSKRYEEKINILKKTQYNTEILVDKDIFKETSEYIKNMGFTFLSDITSVDYKDHFILVYQFFNYNRNDSVTLKIKLENYENPEIDSLTSIWETADWHEREVYDLMGIIFKDHPNLKRILMWEGYKGHPLRKDFPPVTRKRNWEVE